MKRLERKHLKEDELAHTLRVARELVEPRRQILKNVGIAAVVVLVAVVAIGLWRERSDSRGEKELAEAMVALNADVVPIGAQAAEGVPAPGWRRRPSTGSGPVRRPPP